jgi:hypothetical protein
VAVRRDAATLNYGVLVWNWLQWPSDMRNSYYFVLCSWLLALMLLSCISRAQRSTTDKCPSVNVNPSCPCYNFEDGIFLECPSISLRALSGVLEEVKAPIKSLSIYDLDRNVTRFPDGVFPNNTVITHIQITQSSIRDFTDNSLQVRFCQFCFQLFVM